MKIVVIGSGGREHAIVHTLKKSPQITDIYVIPGNAGTENIAKNIDIDINNNSQIIDFCLSHNIDLVVVGPEQPLANGLVDDLSANNIKAFGPTKLASQLESSKYFTKKICDEYSIPTAKYQQFNNYDDASAYLQQQSFPIVIKEDGLAAGKGVVIADNLEEGLQALQEMYVKKNHVVVIEEFLEGQEISFFAICSGLKATIFSTAQDYKRASDGNVGANTGGMGTISPSPLINDDLQNRIMQEIIEPTLRAMNDKNMPFMGVLFAGIMMVSNQPKLLEFNTRFGDPETQVMMARLDCDLVDILLAASENREIPRARFLDKKAVCVVMASKGYPADYLKNTIIKLPNNLSDGVKIFHAGTRMVNGELQAIGGRVLGITSIAAEYSLARNISYSTIQNIDWPEGFCRSDIGDGL
jgi:phosphoribosylamine---glycine ligase